jgi:hypothetical protein
MGIAPSCCTLKCGKLLPSTGRSFPYNFRADSLNIVLLTACLTVTFTYSASTTAFPFHFPLFLTVFITRARHITACASMRSTLVGHSGREYQRGKVLHPNPTAKDVDVYAAQ